MLHCFDLETGPRPRASLIVLHGLGADGRDFLSLSEDLKLLPVGPVRFVLPSAPVMPVTLNGGHVMPAWFDIIPTPQGGRIEDEVGLRRSQAQIDALIEREIARGIPASRIVLMGFSQGCAMTLMTGLRSPHRLAGMAGLSGYLPLPDLLEQERNTANLETPIFLAHGSHDDMVVPERGLRSRDQLQALKHPVSWHSYAMGHTLCLQELRDLNAWLLKVLA